MDIHELEAHIAALTEHQQRILQVLYEANQTWLTRSKIAHLLDKKKLTPYDVECLNLLNERGLVDVSHKPSRAPGIPYAYLYRISESALAGIQSWEEHL